MADPGPRRSCIVEDDDVRPRPLAGVSPDEAGVSPDEGKRNAHLVNQLHFTNRSTHAMEYVTGATLLGCRGKKLLGPFQKRTAGAPCFSAPDGWRTMMSSQHR